MNLDFLLYAAIAAIVLGGVALAVAGVRIVNALTWSVCSACKNGHHDEPQITEGVRCRCACHEGRS